MGGRQPSAQPTSLSASLASTISGIHRQLQHSREDEGWEGGSHSPPVAHASQAITKVLSREQAAHAACGSAQAAPRTCP